MPIVVACDPSGHVALNLSLIFFKIRWVLFIARKLEMGMPATASIMGRVAGRPVVSGNKRVSP